jgi:hypothetical protein
MNIDESNINSYRKCINDIFDKKNAKVEKIISEIDRLVDSDALRLTTSKFRPY